MKRILIEVSPGELVDRVTILEIKSCTFGGDKLANVQCYLSYLKPKLREVICTKELYKLQETLKICNEALWNIQERLHNTELTIDFFETLCLSHRLNDQRSDLKRAIDRVCGSDIGEEKSYNTGVKEDV